MFSQSCGGGVGEGEEAGGDGSAADGGRWPGTIDLGSTLPDLAWDHTNLTRGKPKAALIGEAEGEVRGGGGEGGPTSTLFELSPRDAITETRPPATSRRSLKSTAMATRHGAEQGSISLTTRQ